MTNKFFKKILNTKPLSYFVGRIVAYKLKIDGHNNTEIQEYVHFSLSWRFMGLMTVKPSQIAEEIIQLLKIIREKQPKILLEIGTFSGGTLYLFSKVANFDATLISVDLEDGYSLWKTFFYRRFSGKHQKIYVLQENSHNLSTLEKIELLIHNKKVDVLYIDGDHSYNGVKKDFEMYCPLVRENGIVIFHDIVSGNYDQVAGVPKFWNEIKNSYSHLEIIKDYKQKGFGLGIIYF